MVLNNTFSSSPPLMVKVAFATPCKALRRRAASSSRADSVQIGQVVKAEVNLSGLRSTINEHSNGQILMVSEMTCVWKVNCFLRQFVTLPPSVHANDILIIQMRI